MRARSPLGYVHRDMSRPLIRLVLLIWGLCACLLLLPQAAAGSTSVVADFDGDGRNDTVRLDQHRPSVLQVWLSASGTTHVLVSRRPLRHVVADDLDGDRRPELIASDSQSRIHVWTPRPKGFRAYHPRQAIPKELSAPSGRSVDGRNGEPKEAVTGGATGPFSLTRTLPLVPPDDSSIAGVQQAASARPASPAVQPWSPRPPPA